MCRWGAAAAAGKRGPPKILDFVLADDIEADAPIVALSWIGEQVRLCPPHAVVHAVVASCAAPFPILSCWRT